MSMDEIGKSFESGWQSFTQALGKAGAKLSPQLEQLGGKLGVVKLTPETCKHIDGIVNEAMRGILNEATLRNMGVVGNPYTSVNFSKKAIKEIRSDIKEAVTKAVINSIKDVAKEKKIALPSKISIHEATQSKKFEKTLNDHLGKGTYLRDSLDAVLSQGSTSELRELTKHYQALREAAPRIDEWRLKAADLTEKGDLTSAESLERKELLSKINEFDDQARTFARSIGSLNSDEKSELAGLYPNIFSDNKAFQLGAKKSRTAGLIKLYQKITSADTHFKSQSKIDKSSAEWKEFSKNVAAFTDGMLSPLAEHFKHNHGALKAHVYNISDNWKIDYNK